MQPLVLSPKVWMCIPRSALASWPWMSQVTVVGDDSESCSKVTVPLMAVSPRMVATVMEEICQLDFVSLPLSAISSVEMILSSSLEVGNLHGLWTENDGARDLLECELSYYC